MASSNLLFLLSLLILFPAALVVGIYATRTSIPNTRVLNRLLIFTRWASRRFAQAPSAPEEQPPPTMTQALIPQRDEKERWKFLIQESEASIEKYLHRGIDIDLASFIRCITFRVFSIVFLGVDPDTLAFENVQRVTGALAEFYDDRQEKDTLPPEARSILYQWLPRDQFPSPLNNILPVYEVLWRVVATLVVNCEEAETKDLCWLMLDFRDNPRDRQYRGSFGRDGKSVSDITNEVLAHLTPIARLQRGATSDTPLSWIQNAAWNTPGWLPAVEEALKFAALLASRVVGQVGVHYGISGGGITEYGAAPWNRRKIYGMNRSIPGQVVNNSVERFPHVGSSSRVY